MSDNDVTGIPFDYFHPKESGEQKSLKAALLACQTAWPSIPRNGVGKIKYNSAKSGEGSFEYKYAKFQDIMDIVRPILNNAGVLFSQLPFPCIADGNLYIITELEHVDTGGRRWVYYPVCDYTNAKQQEVGANMTYAKRYSLVILGIILDEDTDAQHTEARTASRGPRRPTPQPPREQVQQDMPPHDPATGEVKPGESATAKALYARITGDGINGSMIGALGTEINNTIKGEGRNAVLHAALNVRLIVFNAVKEADLNVCHGHIATIKKTTLDTADLEKIIEVKRTELNAASMTSSMRDIGEDSRFSDGRANT